MHCLDNKNNKGENSMWGKDKQKTLLKNKAYIEIKLHDGMCLRNAKLDPAKDKAKHGAFYHTLGTGFLWDVVIN